MSCRSSAGNSAVTSLARMQSGLSDMQTLSTFHALIREGQAQNLEQPGEERVSEWLSQLRQAINSNATLNQPRRASLLTRLAQVGGQPTPNAATFYAWQNIEERTNQLAANLARWQASFLEATYGREVLATLNPAECATLLAQQRQQFNQLRQASDTNRQLVADPEWLSQQATFLQTAREDAYADQPQLAELARRGQELPTDRGTQYALWQMVEQLEQAQPVDYVEATAPTHCGECGQFLPLPPHPHLCPGAVRELAPSFTNTNLTSPVQDSGAFPATFGPTVPLTTNPELAETIGITGAEASSILNQPQEISVTPLTFPEQPAASEEISQAARANSIAASTSLPAPRLATAEGAVIYQQWVAELTTRREQANSNPAQNESGSGASSSGPGRSPFSERGGPPYETENVLGAAATTFGVELEFRAANTDALARRLYDMGLAGHPHMTAYHHSCEECEGYWKVERDGSVTEVVDGQNIGGEIVAPVLSDTPGDWEALAKVSQVLVEAGAVVDANTGQHVHVGTASYGTSGTSYRNLAVLLAANEDLVYRLAAPEVEYHRGLVRTDHAAYHYAQPLAERLDELLVVSATPTLAEVLRAGGVFEASPHRRRVPLAHYIGLNLQHVSTGSPESNRVEFRHFNGTLDPAQIQTNVRLAAAMAHAANQPDFEVPTQDSWQTLGSHRAQRTPAQSADNFRQFVDRLGLSESGAKALLDTFLRSTWQPARRPSAARIQQALDTYRAVR